jgi:hypothetical protein
VRLAERLNLLALRFHWDFQMVKQEPQSNYLSNNYREVLSIRFFPSAIAA